MIAISLASESSLAEHAHIHLTSTVKTNVVLPGVPIGPALNLLLSLGNANMTTCHSSMCCTNDIVFLVYVAQKLVISYNTVCAPKLSV